MAPQSRALPVLITRPDPQGQRFSAALLDRHGTRVAPVACPMIAPEFLPAAMPDGVFEALIMTSETAGLAAGRMARAGAALPRLAYCVGDRTAEVAREQGFDARSAQGDADALIALILRQPDGGGLLHLHGRDTRGDVVGQLRAAGRDSTGLEVYVQREQPLSNAAQDLLAQSGSILVPLFSPRTAALFAAHLTGRQVLAQITYVTISPAVAEMLGETVAKVEIATQPTQQAMMIAMDKVIIQT